MTTSAVLIGRKEAGDLLLSLRGLGWLILVSAALSSFALLLVSNTELSLLDNAQVVYDMTCIVTALGSLLALVVGLDTIGGERGRGSLLALLLAPLSRAELLFGKLIGIALSWLVMALLAVPYVWAVGSTGQNLGASLILLGLFGTPVVLGFGFLGMALGAWLKETRSGQICGLVVLVTTTSPLVLGPGLRQSRVGQILNSINPFASAANAFDAGIINSIAPWSMSGYMTTVAAWFVLTFRARLGGLSSHCTLKERRHASWSAPPPCRSGHLSAWCPCRRCRDHADTGERQSGVTTDGRHAQLPIHDPQHGTGARYRHDCMAEPGSGRPGQGAAGRP